MKVENAMVSFEKAFNSFGESLYSDEFACELLAWFYYFGSSNEAVVINDALNSALQVCAIKLGFEARKIPDAGLVKIWQKKRAEIKKAIDDKQDFPVWMVNILKRYKLRSPVEGIDFERTWRNVSEELPEMNKKVEVRGDYTPDKYEYPRAYWDGKEWQSTEWRGTVAIRFWREINN